MFIKNYPPLDGAVCVATVYNAMEAGMVQELLKNNGIASMRRPLNGFDPMPTLTGSSIFGEEVYVRPEDAEQALALVAAFMPEEGAEQAAALEGATDQDIMSASSDELPPEDEGDYT